MTNSGLRIVVWNVEHGAAIYISTPNGRVILLDAGASDSFSPAAWLHNRWSISETHMFILSHADADHVRDIESVDRLLRVAVFVRNRTAPRELVYPTFPPDTEPLKYYYGFDERYTADLAPDSPYRREPASNWGNVVINWYYNNSADCKFTKLNDYSLVTSFLYGNLQFMFPGDLEAPGWDALLARDDFRNICTPNRNNPGEIRILVGAHHGREAGVHAGFLSLFKPHLSIISDKWGVENTDYASYNAASLGFPVFDNGSNTTQTRRVVSTKTNDYVLVASNGQQVSVVV